MFSKPSDLKAIVFGGFFISWHRFRKVKKMLEGIDQGFSKSANSHAFSNGSFRLTSVMHHRPNAHATIRGNSSRQNTPPCDPARSFMMTSAPASRSASANLFAFPRKNGSCVPATRHVRGSGSGMTPGGL
jgi:hypothetical protein